MVLSCPDYSPPPPSYSLDLLILSAPPSISVDSSLLQWSLGCGTIPLVCPVGRDSRGCSVILDSTEVTAAVSRALKPYKVVFLNTTGGLRSQEHKVKPGMLWALMGMIRWNSLYWTSVSVAGSGDSVVAQQPAYFGHSSMAEQSATLPCGHYSQAAQSAADGVVCSDHVCRHTAHRALQSQRWDAQMLRLRLGVMWSNCSDTYFAFCRSPPLCLTCLMNSFSKSEMWKLSSQYYRATSIGMPFCGAVSPNLKWTTCTYHEQTFAWFILVTWVCF